MLFSRMSDLVDRAELFSRKLYVQVTLLFLMANRIFRLHFLQETNERRLSKILTFRSQDVLVEEEYSGFPHLHPSGWQFGK